MERDAVDLPSVLPTCLQSKGIYRASKKVGRIYNQYISGCISVTKMNQVSPESLIKDIFFEGISTVADRVTEPR